MNLKKVNIQALIDLLPDTILDDLAFETGVNRHVKKLRGQVMFKLLLFSVLKTDRVSLNYLVKLFETTTLRKCMDLSPEWETSRTSLADRLSTMEVSYFEELYRLTCQLVEKHVPSQRIGSGNYVLHRFDSTVLLLSSKLLSLGAVTGKKFANDPNKRLHQLKFSIGFDGLRPFSADLYTEPRHLAEDQALYESIAGQKASNGAITLFDQGIKKRNSFRRFSEEGRCFVTRIRESSKYEVVKACSKIQKGPDTGLELLDDQVVYLYQHRGLLEFPFRLVRAKRTRDDKLFYFLSNHFGLSAQQIAQLYQKRWDIEVFFRFLKQELNFTHLLNRSENGIRIMLYMSLIAAMLILLYRHFNKTKGYKMTKIGFCLEIENAFTRLIVEQCGGDVEYFDRRYGQRRQTE